jgi:hypothetical protein
MKLITLFFFIISFSFVKSQIVVKDSISGYMVVEDGKGENVNVNYDISGLSLDSLSLAKILNKVRAEALLRCKNMSSFRPYKKSHFLIAIDKHNQIAVLFNFLAQNSYGAESDIMLMCTFDKNNYKFIMSN